MKTLLPLLLFAASTSACALVPDVEYQYYLPKSATVITVSQTVDCSSDKTKLIVVNAATVTPAYSSDLSKRPYIVKLRDIEGTFAWFADSDLAFGFYDDGRLKSINQSTTGQGEAIIKSAVSVAAAFAPLGGGAAAAPGTTLSECDTVQSWGGGKPVTLNYTANMNFITAAGGLLMPLPIATGSNALFVALNKNGNLPTMGVQVGGPTVIESGARKISNASDTNAVDLSLEKTEIVRVDVTANGVSFWTGYVTIPGNDIYSLPIPKAALFGKQTFSVTLNEAGSITAIDYGKTTGASGALNAAGAIATAEAPESAAAKAADVKAQADLIAQQQRLARCQAQPDKCQ